MRIHRLAAALSTGSLRSIEQAKGNISMLHRQLMLYAPALLRNEQKRIELNESKLRSASPDRILRLGFSITRLDGKAVRDVTQLREGDEIETSLASGTLKSIVKWTRKLPTKRL